MKTNKKEMPEDPMISYSPEGVPVSKKMEEGEDKQPRTISIDPNRGAQKKQQGTEDAQKRSDTGTGL